MRADQDVFELDLFALLGVAPSAGAQEIRAAYRRKVRHSHPDLNPADPDAERRTALLNRAARVLLDPTLRASYERSRNERKRAAPARRAWYEGQGGGDGEWLSPEPAPPPSNSAGARAFARRVRSSSAALAARAAAFVRELERDRVLLLAALCIALGSGLLVWSNPVNAFWSGEERELAPYVVAPTQR